MVFFFRLINFLKKFIFLSNLILNMVKKFNNDEIFIKGLLDSKMKPAEILKKYKEKYKSLKLTYQKLNYWKSIKFNKPIVRKVIRPQAPQHTANAAREEAEVARKQQEMADKAAETAASAQAKLAEKERIAAQKAAEKAEAERLRAEEKRRVQAEREAEKAKEKSQKVKDRVIGNILGSAGSAIGRKAIDKIFKDIFK